MPQKISSFFPSVSLSIDFYEFTMVAGYFHKKIADKIAVFDIFYRQLPHNRETVIAAGIETALHFLKQFHFEEQEVDYILSHPMFTTLPEKEQFRDYLLNLKFEGDVWAVAEGTLVFPNEPIMEIEAPLGVAQLLETALLSIIGHQSIIATKAARVVEAANGKVVIDFGARRAHGLEAALLGARSAYIAGCAATSNVLTGFFYDIPISGTQAHSWIQSFKTEMEAFRSYIEIYPEKPILLIDTYDYKKGALHAALINQEQKKKGKPPIFAVRVDSGDLLEETREIRRILDENESKEVKIIVSGDLNEYKIRELEKNNAPIDAYGVGTEMIVSRDDPALSIVYKLSELDGVPKIKLSPSKMTYPGKKQLYRRIDEHGNYFDILTLRNDSYPNATPLLKKFMEKGEIILPFPSAQKVREYTLSNLKSFRAFKELQIGDPLKTVLMKTKNEMESSLL